MREGVLIVNEAKFSNLYFSSVLVAAWLQKCQIKGQ